MRVKFARIAIIVTLTGGVLTGCGSDDETSSSDAATTVATATETMGAETTETTATVPAQTLQDAQAAVDDDHYAAALAIAAAIGGTDVVRRRIANRIARRILFAVSSGNRGRARFLLTSVRNYPSTTLTRQAATRVQAAEERAAARARAARSAAEQRRQERAAAKAERERQRELEQAAPPPAAQPSVPSGGTCADSPVKNFPVPPGDPRDRDGDGIACES